MPAIIQTNSGFGLVVVIKKNQLTPGNQYSIIVIVIKQIIIPVAEIIFLNSSYYHRNDNFKIENHAQ